MTALASLGLFRALIILSFIVTAAACAILLTLLIKDWKAGRIW